MKISPKIALFLMACLLTLGAAAEFRFPMPEFDSGYTRPQIDMPGVALTPPWLDIALLTLALGLAAWLVHKKRSRNGLLALSVASLLYFGFYRKGCVCSIGAIQNMLAVCFSGVAAPLAVSAFFFLPLAAALYFGRVFCAAVCPLGALQEIAAVRPVTISAPVAAVLGLLPYAYLGLAAVGVATGAGFLICRYDPFVGFFRMGGSFNMLLAGGVLLALGTVVARPYCRFLCPYGVLLRWVSCFSKWRVTITPAECIQCRLCENACPYDAILVPTPSEAPESRRTGVQRLALLLAVAPLIVAAAAGTGAGMHGLLARLHPTVQLAGLVAAEEAGHGVKPSIETDAWRAGKQTIDALYAEAATVEHRFLVASLWFGAFMGLVICGKLIRYSVVRNRVDYEADRGACVACGRCYPYCPVEKK